METLESRMCVVCGDAIWWPMGDEEPPKHNDGTCAIQHDRHVLEAAVEQARRDVWEAMAAACESRAGVVSGVCCYPYTREARDELAEQGANMHPCQQGACPILINDAPDATDKEADDE